MMSRDDTAAFVEAWQVPRSVAAAYGTAQQYALREGYAAERALILPRVIARARLCGIRQSAAQRCQRDEAGRAACEAAKA